MGWAARANLATLTPRPAKSRDVSPREAEWLARWYAMTDRVFGIPVIFTKKKDAVAK